MSAGRICPSFFATTYAACGKERRHGVVDGFLCGAEILVGTVGPAKGIAWVGSELGIDCGQIAGGQHHVGVEYQYIFTRGALHAIVACLSWARVGLVIIMYGQLVGIACYHVLTGQGRPVLYHQHIKIFQCLCGKALQKFVHLVGAVEYGYDK